MPTLAPVAFSTFDGSLDGAVDGQNTQFNYVPRPPTLLFDVPGLSGSLLFRNGLLIDEYADYAAGLGYFALNSSVVPDVVTAAIYQGFAPTKMRLTGGLTAIGAQTLYITPLAPVQAPLLAFMLFRNGLLLTDGPDYTVNGFWITLLSGDAIQLTDTFVALISTGGLAVSTFDGSITGTINGINAVFFVPGTTTGSTWDDTNISWDSDQETWDESATSTSDVGPILLFRNGQFLTRGLDYFQNGAQVTLLGDQIPQPGDTLTAQVYGHMQVSGVPATWDNTTLTWQEDTQTWDNATANAVSIAAQNGPTQISNFDGTMTYQVSVESLLYRNGLLMTQTADAVTLGNSASFQPWQTPQLTDVVTLEDWTADVLNADMPAFNLPTQFSTNEGSISGDVNGMNNVFTLVTGSLVTDFIWTWNGLEMTFWVDYSWVISQAVYGGPWTTVITMMGGQIPRAGDVVTAQVFMA